MRTKTNYFKIGTFVITAIVMVIVGIIILGVGVFFQKKIVIESYFEEAVQGLDVGAPLKFRGVRFGQVDEISIVGKAYPTDRRYILVRASLPLDVFRLQKGRMTIEDFNAEIKKGLRVRLTSQGLTGSAFLEMDYMDPLRYPFVKMDWKPRNIYIPSAPSTITRIGVAVDRITRSLEKINLEGITDGIQGIVRSVGQIMSQEKVTDLINQTQNLMAEIRQTNTRLQHLLKTPQADSILPNVAATLKATRRIVERTEKPLSELLQSLTQASANVKRLAHDLTSFSESLPENSAELRKILRRVDRLISNQQKDIAESVDNLRLFSENLKELSENAKKDPSRFLFGKPPVPKAPGRKP